MDSLGNLVEAKGDDRYGRDETGPVQDSIHDVVMIMIQQRRIEEFQNEETGE